MCNKLQFILFWYNRLLYVLITQQTKIAMCTSFNGVILSLLTLRLRGSALVWMSSSDSFWHQIDSVWLWLSLIRLANRHKVLSGNQMANHATDDSNLFHAFATYIACCYFTFATSQKNDVLYKKKIIADLI